MNLSSSVSAVTVNDRHREELRRMDDEGTESNWGDLLEQVRQNVSLARDKLDELLEQLN